MMHYRFLLFDQIGIVGLQIITRHNSIYTHNFDPLSSHRKTLSYTYSTQPLMLNYYYQQNIYRKLIPKTTM